MINTSQALPPKMAAEFARLAKEGNALMHVAGMYTFIRGNQIITLSDINHPKGLVRKARPGEIDRLKADAAKAAEKAIHDNSKTARYAGIPV